MAIRIIYDQTLPATGNGDSAGWIKVLDVTQLVAGCTGFIYDHDTGPIGVRVEAIDSPNSKLQLSILQPSGSYLVSTLVAYTVLGGTAVKIPQQAREDAGYVPPAGGAIAGLVAGGSTAGSGFVTFADSNGVTFGMSNNILTASVQTAGGGGNLALSAGNYSTNSGTVLFRNSNGMSFGMDTNGEITGAYTVPDISQINFSNSNNVTFGVNGWTVTASASFSQTVQTQGLVNIEGSTGTIHFDNANGISFGGNNNTITASVVIPPQTVQTQNLVSIKGSTGNIFFDNANGLTFGGNNSTITASYTVPAIPPQTVQPVAASASNGSFAFSTLGFNQGGGVTFSTNVNGINAIVKTDYQSSNANYLTSQSNQAVSGSNGSFAFQTLSLGASNGASFYTTNGSVVVSYTVPSVPAQTYQPVAVSGSNGSFTASTLSFGQSNGVTFYTTNGSLVASYTVPAIPGATVFSNSNNVSFGLNGSTITASATFAGGGAAISAAGGSQNTGTVVFSNSNGISFGYNAGTITATVNPGAAAGIAAQGAGTQTATSGTVNFINSNNVSFGMTNSSQITASASFAQSTQPVAISGSNGSSTFATLTMGNSNGLTHYMTNGSLVGSYTVPGATVFSNSNNVSFGLNGSTVTATATFPAQTVQPVAASASNGSFNFSTLRFVEGSGVTWATQVNGIQASVKTDYQSSNANYLTSQSNQALSGSNGSFAFQTASFGNSNGATFYTTNGSMVVSYTVPTQTVQPVAVSGSNGSFAFSTLTMGASNGLSFYTTNGSVVGSYTVPTVPAHTGPTAIAAGTQTATSGTQVFSNSNNVSFTMNGSSQIVASASFPAQTVQTQNLHNVTLSGNTAGVMAQISSGTLSLAGGNNITLSQNGNAVTISGPNTVAQSVQPVAASGSNGSFAFSTLSFGASNGATFYTTNNSVVVSYTVPSIPGATVFSNSNNVSFGLNGSTVTATATFPAQTVQPVAASGSNGSFAYSTLSFGVSNGATFYTTNGSIVVSYTVPNTVAQTVQPVAASGSNGSFAFSTLSFGNSNGLTHYTTNGSIVGSYTVPGATVFSNSNNVSFGLNGSTVTATATFPAQTVQPVAISGSNGSFAYSTLTMGNSNGLTFYTTNGSLVGSYTVPAIPGATVFSNSNNVSFGLNGSTVTATATFPAQTVQPVAASASNGSYNFSTLRFVEGSGVTWATQAGGIQASVKTDYQSSNANYLTSQSTGPAAIAVPGTTVSSGTIIFSNSNGVSFGYGTGTATNIITVTVQPGAAAGVAAFSAGTAQATSGTVQFVNSNGVSFGMGTGASYGQLTASISPAAATGIGAIAGGGNTATSGTVVFSNSNNVSFSFNGSTQMVASASFPAQTQFVLSNSNGVTFGTNGSTVTASYSQSTAPSAIVAGAATFTNGSVWLSGSGGVTVTNNGNTAIISFDGHHIDAVSPSGNGFGTGFSLISTGTLGLNAGNNISMSQNGGNITIQGPTVPAQTVQPVAVSGSNGSFAFSTLTLGSSNGMHFYTTNGSVVGSYTVPTIPGATVFSNSNNVSFGLNGSTVTATATFAQSVQPVAASASNGSFAFSTLRFSEGGGVTWSTNANGINATVKTDYQSSNANYLTSQSNQAFSASGGSSAFQTLGFSNQNNVTFSNSNGSIVASASFAQSVQPVAASGSNGSFQFSTLTFGASNGATFYTTNNSMVVSYTVPTQSTQAVAASGSNGSFTFSTLTLGSSNGMHFYTTNGSVVGSYTQPALTQLAAGTNITLTSNGSTISIVGPVFSNSNNVSFGANAGTITASATFAQTTQPVAVSGSNGSFAFSTLTLGSSNGMHFYTTNGSVVGSYTVPSIPGATVFSNSNNVSFGLNGSTVTATATFAQTAQTLGLYAISNTTGASSSNTVDARSFSIQGAGNISVGLTNGSFVISQTGGAGGATSGGGYLQGNTTGQSSSSTYALSSLNVSGAGNVSVGWSNSSMIISGGGGAGGAALKGSGTYSQNTGTVEFANSNGVTFGLSNNGTMTASFAQSQITGGTNITLSSNGSTVSIIGPTFANGNNVTFGVNGQTITASATFAPFLGLYAIGNTTGNGSSDTFDARSVTMSGAGNVSVGWSNDSFIISGAGGGGGAAVGISTAGNTQGTSGNFSNGTYIFEGSNGLSVSQLTAATPGVQTLRLVAPTQTAFVLSSSNGIGFGTNGSTVTASYAHSGPTGVVVNASASTLTNGNLVFSNSNNITFGINGSTITASASAQSVQTMGLYAVGSTTGQSSSSTFDARTLSFRGSHAYVGYSGGSIVISADAYNNLAVPGTTASTDATVVFSNSNGISFGLGGANNSQMTAALSQAIYVSSNSTGQSSQSTYNASALTLVGDGGISVGWSNGSLRISGNQGNISQTGPNIADGNGVTITSGTVVFSNSNNVSFGMAGSTMTASAGGGGGAYTALTFQNRQLGASSNTVAGQNSVWLVPMRVGAPVSASSLLQMASLTGTVTSNQTNTVGVTYHVMVYKNTAATNSSRFDSIWSAAMGLTVWNSGTASVSYSISGIQNTSSSSAGSGLLTASVFGLRQLTFTIGSTLDTGLYAYGFRVSTSSAGNSSVLRSFNPVIDNPMPVAQGFIGSATNQSIGYVDGGTFSVTSGAMPASFLLSEIRQTNNAVPYVKIGAA